MRGFSAHACPPECEWPPFRECVTLSAQRAFLHGPCSTAFHLLLVCAASKSQDEDACVELREQCVACHTFFSFLFFDLVTWVYFSIQTKWQLLYGKVIHIKWLVYNCTMRVKLCTILCNDQSPLRSIRRSCPVGFSAEPGHTPGSVYYGGVTCLCSTSSSQCCVLKWNHCRMTSIPA